ncbi:MAG: DUF4276 family protein [Anaerolineae bacterium]|nr:DUF4276 family protein [Anaerolineae bacterium]
MQLLFFVEEPSAEAALIELVPKILSGRRYKYDIFTFQGKQDLLKKLPKRLRAYRAMPGDDWAIIVLVDRDQDDCKVLKQQLETTARDAGLATRASRRPDERITVVNRIAIEELEAWFLGDPAALHAAYPRVTEHLAHQARFRDPDAIQGGTWETLESLLAYYHPGGLEKIRAASEISAHMEPDLNRSKSFQVFRDALRSLFT